MFLKTVTYEKVNFDDAVFYTNRKIRQVDIPANLLLANRFYRPSLTNSFENYACFKTPSTNVSTKETIDIANYLIKLNKVDKYKLLSSFIHCTECTTLSIEQVSKALLRNDFDFLSKHHFQINNKPEFIYSLENLGLFRLYPYRYIDTTKYIIPLEAKDDLIMSSLDRQIYINYYHSNLFTLVCCSQNVEKILLKYLSKNKIPIEYKKHYLKQNKICLTISSKYFIQIVDDKSFQMETGLNRSRINLARI